MLLFSQPWVEDGAASTARCDACGLDWDNREAPVPTADHPVEHCWLCGNEEFYVQKDFNRQLGVFIVVTSALLVFLVMLLTDHRVGLWLLAGIALVDFFVYHRLSNVTVCYLCQSLHRDFPQNPQHTGFYLGSEEKYKKLRQEWLERFDHSDPQPEEQRSEVRP
jgi:hypothetical protein